MQKLKMPVTLDVRKAAQHSTSYEGYMVLAGLKRFTQDLNNNEGDVDIKMQTGFDEQGLAFVKGEAKTQVTLTCQRCNEDMNIDLHCEFAWSPVKPGYDDDGEAALPEYYEPVEVNEFGEIDLRALVEDELILSLPIIPMHDVQDCPARDMPTSYGKIDDEVETETKPNPFAVLNQLKRH